MELSRIDWTKHDTTIIKPTWQVKEDDVVYKTNQGRFFRYIDTCPSQMMCYDQVFTSLRSHANSRSGGWLSTTEFLTAVAPPARISFDSRRRCSLHLREKHAIAWSQSLVNTSDPEGNSGGAREISCKSLSVCYCWIRWKKNKKCYCSALTQVRVP